MIREAIEKVVRRENLTMEEAEQVMQILMEGKATEAQMGSLLTALRMKGETAEEITGCARAMRAKAQGICTGHLNLIDTCGTGGDGSGTFNISTTSAFIAAGAGLAVAKHGNRSVSSKSGSADVLEALGVNLELTPEQVESTLDRIGIAFLYAPSFHKAMRHVVGARKEIGIRSIFNILGPLTNPAGASGQVLGVYDPELTETMAQVLRLLGVDRAFVVHGAGGLDELSTIGPSRVSYLSAGKITNLIVDAEEYGLKKVSLECLKGGDSLRNAEITLQVLEGVEGPYREITLLNAAAALMVGGMAEDLTEGLVMAKDSIASGRARSKLEELITVSNSYRSENSENISSVT